MGLLEKNKIHENDNTLAKTPRFDKDGKVHHKWIIIPKVIGFLIIILGLLIGSIHLPVLLSKKEIATKDNPLLMTPNEAGIRNALQYVQDHPSDDTDSDGLTNSEEAGKGTDPRNPDTDYDGVSDYAEIYLYNTYPTEADNKIIEVFQSVLDEREMSYNTPFKIHDIIMWADNIESRARGIVVPSLRGYRFVNFNGWVQFPQNYFPYKIEDGFHVPLERREAENVWRIDSLGTTQEIVVYNTELPRTHMLTAFGKRFSIENNDLANILGFLLPKDNSFITLKDVILQDLLRTDINATVTGTTMPVFDRNDMSRFGKNMNGLSDIVDVYTSILSGKPVVVSLQSSKFGEVICLAYGYTEYGDLLLADEEGNKEDKNGTPYILDIIEMAAITVDQTGELRQREYYDFSGIGYDSLNGDKIHFVFAGSN